MDSGNKQNDVHWHNLPIEDLLDDLDTNYQGLSNEESEKRLQQYGPNLLYSKRKNSLSRRYLNRLNRYLIMILLGAILVSIIIEN